MRYTIPRWDTGEAIWSGEAKSMRDAAEQAVRAGVSLFQAELCGADLRRAILCGADLGGADLRRALLTDADLDGADLSRADLTDAYLGGADLVAANLVGATLTGVNLDGAVIHAADLHAADLDAIHAAVIRILDAVTVPVVSKLLRMLRCGQIDGTERGRLYYQLTGELEPSATRPAERWFLAIRPAATPATHPVAAITERWIVEWLTARGVKVPVYLPHEWPAGATWGAAGG